MTQSNFTTVSLNMTIDHDGHIVILPLTPWLLVMWVMFAFPSLAVCCQHINKVVATIDKAVSTLIISILAVMLMTEVKLCYN